MGLIIFAHNNPALVIPGVHSNIASPFVYTSMC